MRRIDVHRETSNRRGIAGVIESVLRRFRSLTFGLMLLPMAGLCCLCMGLALTPGMIWFDFLRHATIDWPLPLHYVALGFGISSGFLMYGISLVFILPAANLILPKVKAFRGPWYSLPAIPWYAHNALVYMMRYTFLEFITPSPFNVLFFRLMGMKIGKGVIINTSHISDPCLITLEDHVTLGGSATIFAHYGQKGFLIISPVTIGQGTTIGLKASVMGGAKIGANVTVRPHAVILPGTKVGDGEVV